VSISQGTPKIASNQKIEDRHGIVSLSELPGGNNPANTLILDFWPLER